MLNAAERTSPAKFRARLLLPAPMDWLTEARPPAPSEAAKTIRNIWTWNASPMEAWTSDDIFPATHVSVRLMTVVQRNIIICGQTSLQMSRSCQSCAHVAMRSSILCFDKGMERSPFNAQEMAGSRPRCGPWAWKSCTGKSSCR